ncbi:hypothetical protein V8C86DRAFT_1012435 [Haematococcus lacustris]
MGVAAAANDVVGHVLILLCCSVAHHLTACLCHGWRCEGPSRGVISIVRTVRNAASRFMSTELIAVVIVVLWSVCQYAAAPAMVAQDVVHGQY